MSDLLYSTVKIPDPNPLQYVPPSQQNHISDLLPALGGEAFGEAPCLEAESYLFLEPGGEAPSI